MHNFHFHAGTVGTLSIETTKIADIQTASVELLDDRSGVVLTTAHLFGCFNRLLGNVTFPRAIVKYRVVGYDTTGKPFAVLLSKSATFVEEDKFQIDIQGENVDYGQTTVLVVTVHNLHEQDYAQYNFTTETVIGFRQALPINYLLVPPRGNGSINMDIVQVTVEPGSSHTFTATVSDGCISHSVSKTITILPLVREQTLTALLLVPGTSFTPLISTQATTTPPPANECGCVNGGTCFVRSVRGRVYRRCACPDGYTGRHCENNAW